MPVRSEMRISTSRGSMIASHTSSLNSGLRRGKRWNVIRALEGFVGTFGFGLDWLLVLILKVLRINGVMGFLLWWL